MKFDRHHLSIVGNICTSAAASIASLARTLAPAQVEMLESPKVSARKAMDGESGVSARRVKGCRVWEVVRLWLAAEREAAVNQACVRKAIIAWLKTWFFAFGPGVRDYFGREYPASTRIGGIGPWTPCRLVNWRFEMAPEWVCECLEDLTPAIEDEEDVQEDSEEEDVESMWSLDS